ncbi:cell cycle checkpoint control protein RAD9B isoform X7 [Mauremys reevesii]|uniref:cell cycle checkpoint control protein RAD9B isoform X7 n=1 Tax=Mauremys reevesii TaxID=260615 RepID=UPI00193EFA1E|nr:cell cycle checkpoint control protein RAD9B isoform X7 [Mauremys reevesii]XP_039361079.1 cell cycle checkpoint control protein RAD9B isoform X7 [Mauremys reevesii]XP_039361080.1 cell cycle checkpoint control protein RAD9B isoform X7 [Mauremys reevesii]XP_039361081.1 cell cycle checkpoint control protein RAD9B isoform X7 [Mauremys reevesii]
MSFGLTQMKKVSAYACVFFSSMFFQHYCWTAEPELCQKKRQLPLTCKLVMKSVLPVFRWLNTLERNVEKCNIYTNGNDCRITFKLFCKHGIVKTYNLAFHESEPLQAVFSRHMCPNVLKIQSRLLTDIMIHFPTCQEEVTVAVTPMKVCFKSYTEEEIDFSKAMHTKIHLNPDEFDYFQIGVDSEVTFCLKELRGLLAFAEATSATVSIHFDVSGKPIAFSIEDMMVEASFVLATLADIENRESSQQSLCLSQRQKRPTLMKAHADNVENVSNNSADNNSNTETIASKKPCWTERAHINTKLPVECRKPLSKEDDVIPIISKKDMNNIEVLDMSAAGDIKIVEKVVPTYSDQYKFHSLFFGAVSFKEQDVISHTLHSLATASDAEDDFDNEQLSQVV